MSRKATLVLFVVEFILLILVINQCIRSNNVQIEKMLNNYTNSIKEQISNIGGANDKLKKEVEDLKNKINFQNEELQKQKQDLDKLKKEFSLIEEVSKRTGLPLKAASSLIKNSKNRNIRVSFVMGLYNYESEFNWNLVNRSSNATGLAQFLPSTAKWIANMYDIPYSYSKLKDPVYNINLTFCYLDYLFKKYKGDEIRVLKEYGDQTKSYPYRVISRGNIYRDLDKRLKNVYK